MIWAGPARGMLLVAAGGTAAGWSAAAVGAVAGGLRGDAVALGIEDDEAAGSFAGAGGLEAGVAQEHVEHAALAGVHGLEAEGLAGVLDLIDSVVGGVAEGAGAGGFEAVGVEGDAVVVLGLEAKNFGGEVLEGAEDFAIVRQKEVCVRALAFDVDVAALEAVGIYGTGAGGDAVFEAKTTGGGKQPHEVCDLFCSSC